MSTTVAEAPPVEPPAGSSQWVARIIYTLLGMLVAGGGATALLGGGDAAADVATNERIAVVEMRVGAVEKAVAEIAPEVRAMREASQQMARSLDVAVKMLQVQDEALRQERTDRKESDGEIRAEMRARPVASAAGGR